MEKRTCVGAYENMLSYNSEFYYRALNLVVGFGIRQLKMKPLTDKFPDLRDQMHSQVVQFYYLMIKHPMLAFKKDILTVVGRRQDIERISKACDNEAQESEKLYQELLENFSGTEGAKQKIDDDSVQELKALETKLSKLAQAVHDIYAQLDDVEAKSKS